MPELPDVTIYVERLAALTVGQPLAGLRVASPFVLRSVDPPPAELVGAAVVGVSRLGKRIVAVPSTHGRASGLAASTSPAPSAVVGASVGSPVATEAAHPATASATITDPRARAHDISR